jgi:hypothetical protein
VSIRKIAGLAAGFTLAVGLIGNGVSAQWTNQVTAQENIHVGSFGCAIVNWTGAGTNPTAQQSVTFDAPAINSSAAGTAPFSFTVKNTGTVAQVLTVSSQITSLPTQFSDMLGAQSPVFLAGNAAQVYNGGLSWTDLSSYTDSATGNIKYTVACSETNQTAIFDNHPSTLPGNLPSFGFESNSISEWGAGVTFAGTARKLSTATVTMSSWACQSGSGLTCVTAPGATFNVPITFTVYNVGTNNAVGSSIASVTQIFAIPYRPSADPTCSTKTQWSDGTNCFNGKAVDITFIFSGQTLPAEAIFGIAFNTTDHGYIPTGVAGAPYDSLNVATYPGTGDGLTAVAPAIGTFLPDGLSGYLADTYAGFYMDNGVGGLGNFRLDTLPAANTTSNGPYGGYEPAVQITATN